ncbi:SMP-30/gluconolactonase/LRE family protein [Rhizorhabdus wittichii]|uniref:SMP-30/gluconolactonase/LRE family protein n=1 Tax=Rhizorhabdus wittichii TaxID=160791 RepID=A0A975HDV6_9SPHN|nr:SMP-30/gluconolactonase/LRE family protein [Rhizorhabdus wittichii]QTH20129.1 SMP-30/gluconolactonase/LRE family protein [Rhizorhabdus wittichii]
MFNPPQLIETRVVARLPESFHVHGRTSERYGNRKYYLEGPVLGRDGLLYFTDVPWGRIFRMTPDGEISLFVEYDGEPNGLKFHRDGRLFVADNRNGIVVIDPISRKVEVLVKRVANEGLRGPNDLTFSKSGDLYFTDQGNSDLQRPHGRVIHVADNGDARILVTDIPSPNGLVLSPKEDWLYLAVTRTLTVWRIAMEPSPGLAPSSPVGTVGVFLQLSGGGGPDGMAVDSAGNVVVAHSNLGSVWIFSPIGEPLYRIKSEVGHATSNIAYGGPDNKTLYITESSSGSILAADLPVAGEKLFGQL